MVDTTGNLEEEYRARIVRKLRAEADRIEAGGSPICYGVNVDDHDLHLGVSGAKLTASFEAPMRGEEWDFDVECHQWGVMVSVEEVVKTAHASDLSNNTTELVEYVLMDPDEAPEPKVLVQECPRCGHEVRVPPGGSCPVCESSGGGDE